MILPIYVYGQPVLRKVARDIPADYPGLDQLISDMYETLDASSGIGLAAPQIGQSIRVVVIDLDVLKDEFPEYAGYRRVFINPHIVEIDKNSEKVTMDEGCLSVPGLSEKVARHSRIRVQYMDGQFQPHDEWVEGYLARVMQHEFDHLEGVLYVDRITPFRKQIIRNKLRAMKQGKFHSSYKTKPAHQ